jgi:translation initiation factor 1
MTAKKRPKGIVYSTNPDFQYKYDSPEEQETPLPGEQDLRIHLQRLKGNKKLTIVRGFKGKETDMQALGKKLKAACGVGGSAKDGEIYIQGDKRDRIVDLLTDYGYKVKKSGG